MIYPLASHLSQPPTDVQLIVHNHRSQYQISPHHRQPSFLHLVGHMHRVQTHCLRVQMYVSSKLRCVFCIFVTVFLISLRLLHSQTQVISIPFTADGKYRPDLPNTPQLLPPPGMRRDPTPSSSRSQLSMLPPGAAHPGVIGDDELGRITQETRQGSYMGPVPTPLRRPTTASLAWTEPPQYQR